MAYNIIHETPLKNQSSAVDSSIHAVANMLQGSGSNVYFHCLQLRVLHGVATQQAVSRHTPGITFRNDVYIYIYGKQLPWHHA